jgi:hypothetical protein
MSWLYRYTPSEMGRDIIDHQARRLDASGLSLSYRYHAGIRLRTSEYFH